MSDFGGNAPYAKMKQVAAICYRHWLAQTNVLFIVGGEPNDQTPRSAKRGSHFAVTQTSREHNSTVMPLSYSSV